MLKNSTFIAKQLQDSRWSENSDWLYRWSNGLNPKIAKCCRLKWHIFYLIKGLPNLFPQLFIFLLLPSSILQCKGITKITPITSLLSIGFCYICNSLSIHSSFSYIVLPFHTLFKGIVKAGNRVGRTASKREGANSGWRHRMIIISSVYKTKLIWYCF